MNREKVNRENMRKILSLIENLKEIETNETKQKIIHWAEKDRKEIEEIQNQLEKIGLLDYAYQKKQITDVPNIENKKDIFDIYHIINMELNHWRDALVCIQTCYREIKHA